MRAFSPCLGGSGGVGVPYGRRSKVGVSASHLGGLGSIFDYRNLSASIGQPALAASEKSKILHLPHIVCAGIAVVQKSPMKRRVCADRTARKESVSYVECCHCL